MNLAISIVVIVRSMIAVVQLNYLDPVRNPDVSICGSTSPENSTTECGPVVLGDCTIEGYLLNFSLSGIHDKQYFCMTPNTPFSIYSSVTAHYRVSCQADIIGPQSDDVTISSAGTVGYLVDSSCEV